MKEPLANEQDSLSSLKELVRLSKLATPGVWKTRGGSADGRGPMFVQAPRLHADDAYDIEVLGEDMHPEHYPEEQQEADCAFVAAAHNSIPSLEALLSLHEKLVAAVSKLKTVRFRGNFEAILVYDELMEVLRDIEGGPTA